MTVGTRTFMELAVPLNGECQIKQETAATDIITVTGASSQTGDFLVLRNSSNTEKFVVDVNGVVTAAGGIILSSGLLRLPIATTAVTTGLVAGDMYILQASTAPQIGLCISAAGNTCYYWTATTTDPAQ